MKSRNILAVDVAVDYPNNWYAAWWTGVSGTWQAEDLRPLLPPAQWSKPRSHRHDCRAPTTLVITRPR